VFNCGYVARERVELLLDPDSPFLELLPLAGYGMDDMTLGGSAVAGIGVVKYVMSTNGCC
jgi:acetyl-CoA carboxylase carboxyltransferase component